MTLLTGAKKTSVSKADFPAGDYFFFGRPASEDSLPVRREDVDAVEEFANPT